MSISKENPDLFYAILSMDAYNRGYGAGIANLSIEGLGLAKLDLRTDDNIAGTSSFFAQSYILNGKTIISYRGTDSKLLVV